VAKSKKNWLSGKRIDPDPIRRGLRVDELIDGTFLAYNSARLREAARLYAERMTEPDCVVGLSLSGAMTPAGIGRSVLIPLIRAGFIDWITTTGANLYHDTHYGLGLAMHQGTHDVDDRVLRQQGVVRIYDILFDFEILLETDAFLREIMRSAEFSGTMSTAELHYLLGKFLAAREDELGLLDSCVLSTAYRCGVPCYAPSPGDSAIGMNIAQLHMTGCGPRIDPILDINETAAIVYDAKRAGGTSGVLILGGGSPKNFILQTEPQIQEIYGLDEKGHDYFVQITDARPDTGGLSGATPGEAVSWGKVDPDKLPGSVVVYCDSTIAAPLIAAYVLERRDPRTLRRLYDRRDEMLARLRDDYKSRAGLD
jgi:deoxyhypusine synthase